MNIVEKVQAISDGIATVKAGFKSALEDKGVTVASDLKLKDYPELVKIIQVGGNADLTNLTPANIKSGVTINGITGTLEQGAEVVVSETEPANPTEGMIWVVVTDSSSGGTDEPSNDTALTIAFTDNSGMYGSYTNMLAGSYTYDSSLDAYKNAGNSTTFGVIKWFNTPPNWLNYNDNGGGGAGWYLCSYNSNNTIKDMFYNLNGSSGDINSITASNYAGSYTMYADSGYTFSFTVSKDSSSGGGSTSNADYIVSGSSTAEANGDYVNTGNTVNGYPSYANGKGYYILYTPNYGGMWQITNDTSASGAPKHSVMSSSALPPTEGWSGVTVTKG